MAYRYDSPQFQYSAAWALFVTVLEILSPINKRIAYGANREVDLNEEVIVITGGASGLGRCLAEIYALRGATVAIIDIKSAKEEEIEGAHYFNCDIGDGEAVKETWAKIKKDVSCLCERGPLHQITTNTNLSFPARDPYNSSQQCCYCAWEKVPGSNLGGS